MYRKMIDKDGNYLSVRRIEDGAVIPLDPNNSDYAEFTQWSIKNNAPLETIDYGDPWPTLDEKVNALLKGGKVLEDLKADIAEAEEFKL